MKATTTTYATNKAKLTGKRYRCAKPRWFAINHPEQGWIIVDGAMDVSTPWAVIEAATEKELRKLMGDKWPEQQ
jgi:hypothetical protein